MATRVNKGIALLLIAMLAVSSLIMVESASAQSISKPSVPEFTLKFVEHPFEVAPTTTIDPYTGENVTVRAGRHVQNRSIEVIIGNQPFTPYEDSNGNHIYLFYNVSKKGHYENNWHYFPEILARLPLRALDNDYTIVSFWMDQNWIDQPPFPLRYDDDPYTQSLGDISAGGQVDFRVQALVGCYSDPSYKTDFYNNFFTGETSGWSNTQTITIDGSASVATPDAPASQNSTASTPIQPGSRIAVSFDLSWSENAIIVLFSIIAVLVAVVAVFLRIRSKRQTS